MNNKMFFPIIALIIMVLPAMAITTTPDVYVHGIVYSGAGIDSPPVEGVEVDVRCWSESHDHTLTSLPTDSTGYFDVLFDFNNCFIGDNVQACVGNKCSAIVTAEDELPNPLIIVGVDIFNVPEFTAVAVGLAATGGIVGFLFLRKRN
ncbi:MAG: hypothetical protein QXG00_03875 [Candidatus Woesearchaeota archaeon]